MPLRIRIENNFTYNPVADEARSQGTCPPPPQKKIKVVILLYSSQSNRTVTVLILYSN